MSRSRKKNPISGHSCKESEKWDKIFAHRKFRKMSKHLLKRMNEENMPFKMQEVSDNWCFQKDGRRNWKYHRWFINYFVSDEFVESIYRK